MSTEPIDSNVLRDAIALEFFLNHITEFFDTIEKDEDHVKALTLLATSAFHIANIFCETRNQFNQKPV